MKLILFFSSLIVCLILFSCKTGSKIAQSDAPKPLENYSSLNEQPLISTINIPVNIARWELESAINKSLFDLLYEDADLHDDGLQLRAWKIAPISLQLSGNEIRYRVPLNIWVKKALAFGTAAEVEGDIALTFKTVFNIREDWSLETWTTIEGHEWLKKPKLKTSLWDIPVETLANLILNKSKSTLTESIDGLVRDEMSLRPAVQTAWDALQTPSLMSEDYKMWVKTTPISLSLTPLRCENEVIKTNIGVEAISEVTMGAKPFFRANSTVPPFRFSSETKDDFAVQIETDVPFVEAEALARKMVVGQSFTSAGKTVKVEDIRLFGQNEKLVVETRLSGAFNGRIFFLGKPVFDSTANSIRMQDFDYQVDTKNFLLRSASWIFQGTIKRMMEKSLVFPLDENVAAIQTTLSETLKSYEIKPGIVLTGLLDELRFQRVFLTPTSIKVDLSARGKLNLDVKGL